MTPILRAGALLLSALPIACGRGPDSVAATAIRDSAGVRIVDNGQVSPGAWRVETSPLFTLGWSPGEPTFAWVQSGQILGDGGALVADFVAKEIYRIGPDGSVAATWGRRGEGPGEYQGLDAMLLRGDSILVSDTRLRRLTVLSLAGEVLGTRPLPGSFLHQVSSFLSDGRLLLIPGDAYAGVSDTRPEWVFQRQPIIAAGSDGTNLDTLAELPHLRRWYGAREASPGPISVKGRAGGFVDGFAWARADEREVTWYDITGRVVQIARWDEQPTPLTAEFRHRMASRYEEAFSSRSAEKSFVAARLVELEEGLNRHEGPLPYWDTFHVDRQGNAWLREYSVPGEPSSRWRVIQRDGTFLGWIDVPDAVSVLDVTDDRILAVALDELDVPAVVMFQLVKRYRTSRLPAQ